MALVARSPAPERNGRERLRVSNMYPANVGAIDRRVIREKLLIPMAVAVSSGSTMPVAKDCRMGMLNMMIVLRAIRRATANWYKLVTEKAAVSPAVRRREAIIVRTSPNRSTILGISR